WPAIWARRKPACRSLQHPAQLLRERTGVVCRRPLVGGEAAVVAGEDRGCDAKERGERLAASTGEAALPLLADRGPDAPRGAAERLRVGLEGGHGEVPAEQQVVA